MCGNKPSLISWGLFRRGQRSMTTSVIFAVPRVVAAMNAQQGEALLPVITLAQHVSRAKLVELVACRC